MISRKILQAVTAVAIGLAVMPAMGQEPPFPSKAITLVVSSAPGALADQAARLYADKMSHYLKQPVVVENVAGAGGLIATRRVAAARPDGYTLLVGANTIAIQPHISSKAGYTLKNLTAVGEMVRSSSLLVVGSASPYKTLEELVAAAKKTPGMLSYGSSGLGTTNHLLVEMIAHKAGVQFMHVPYKGVSTAVPDVLGGRLNFIMPTATSTQELLRKGTLRALAISAEKRSPVFPQIPTLAEFGYADAAFEIWMGLFAPAHMPPAVMTRLADAMEAARNDKELKKSIEQVGQEISSVRTPEQFAAVVAADEKKFQAVIQAANLGTE